MIEREMFGARFLKFLIAILMFLVAIMNPQSGFSSETDSRVILTVNLEKNEYICPETIKITATIFESAPVIGADVSVEVIRPDGSIIRLKARDDGYMGDRQTGDGTYTVIFSDFKGNGSYRFIVRANNEDRKAKIGVLFSDPPPDGAKGKNKLVPAGSFNLEREVKASVSGYRKDISIPPGRIDSLNIEKVGGDWVLLSWLAPGSSAYSGKVQIYELYWSERPVSNKESGGTKAKFARLPIVPKCAGALESYKVTGILSAGNEVYLAIRSRNASGVWSDFSNDAIAPKLRKKRCF